MKIKRTPLTAIDALAALQAAQDAVKDTDGLVLCCLVVRPGEDGRPELFTPTVPPTMMDTEIVAALATTYAEQLTAMMQGTLANNGISKRTVTVDLTEAAKANQRRKARMN